MRVCISGGVRHEQIGMGSILSQLVTPVATPLPRFPSLPTLLHSLYGLQQRSLPTCPPHTCTPHLSLAPALHTCSPHYPTTPRIAPCPTRIGRYLIPSGTPVAMPLFIPIPHTISPPTPRIAQRPTRIGRYLVPTGTPVAMPLFVIHNSKHNWEAPLVSCCMYNIRSFLPVILFSPPVVLPVSPSTGRDCW